MILRTCLCIPTYNNPATIGQVIRECYENTSFPILVIDDGSEPKVEVSAEFHDRVTLIRLPQNRGKGAALQCAMRECLARGFTHMISMDGDGQHLTSDIPKIMEAMRENPWDLIIGNRRLGGENVPQVSRFGRTFSNFWVRFQTEKHISDSQSGFRVYPLFHLQRMSFFTRHFDFEIEVLIRLLWKGVAIREVEIDAYYPKPSERVSHFDKLWDNVRISCLNTALVVLSLLKHNKSPVKSGLALGLGVFVGTSPFYGMHAAMAGALAFLFRLNFLYLLIGTQISIPPLAPLLVSACVAVGHKLAGVDIKTPWGFSIAWLTGWPFVGTGLALLFGFAAWGVARGMSSKGQSTPKGSANWNGRSRGGKIGNGILRFTAQRLGLRAAYFCLYFVVPYFYLFAPKARRSANEYWSAIEPDAGWLKRQRLVLRQLLTFAKILLDRVHQGFHRDPQFKVQSIGMDHVLAPLNQGKGLILLGAHIGGWELAAALLKDYGLTGEFHMIRYQAGGITFEQSRGGQTPEHLKTLGTNRVEGPALAIRELLAAGKPVGLMGDRPLARNFELVPFLGGLAPMDVTPFRIAAATGTPLLFTFGFKGTGRDYEIMATAPGSYHYGSGEDRSLACLRWVAEFAQAMEAQLRRHPEQWFNFFPLFSALPIPPDGGSGAKARNYLAEELSRPSQRATVSESVQPPSV